MWLGGSYLRQWVSNVRSTEGTNATLLRHSGTILVRRYAHLSPSHLQNELEKVAAFGKVTEQQPERTDAQPMFRAKRASRGRGTS